MKQNEYINELQKHTRQMNEFAQAAREFKSAYEKLRQWVRDDMKTPLDKSFKIVYAVVISECRWHEKHAQELSKGYENL